MSARETIKMAYAAFNERNIEGVLSFFHPDVEWPNGWEGGYVYGHHEVREYWTRQWKELDPFVYPVDFKELEEEELEVEVRQVVKKLSGEVLVDGRIYHIYKFQNELIKRMEIKT